MPQTRTLALLPPAELVRPCPPQSGRPMATTGDLLDDSLKTHTAYELCAVQVDKLAAWRRSHSAGAK